MNEVRFVQANYLQMTDKEMAFKLNRPKGSVKGFRVRNNLIKPVEPSYFQKGHEPFNKGKSYKAGGRSAETRFMKGHLPHNTKHDHCITVRTDNRGMPYKMIRLSRAKWVFLSRHVWELVHGEIPKGCIVTFKDKDPLNCEINNLELITRAENARRNANRVKAGVSMTRHWMICLSKETFGIKTVRHEQLKRLFNPQISTI